ncbi:MAG: serine protease [Verrucomicrobiae bacterium]|nr:serine protease [Verrucomicrobiae bacterium]
MFKRKLFSLFFLVIFFFPSPFPSHGQDMSDVVQKVLRSVVVILGSSSDKTALGSGFFVTPQGDVLTNYHVVENMSSIAVRLHNKNIYPAQIRAFDKERDVVLLATNLPSSAFAVIPLSGVSPKIGITVLAIGAPEGLEQSVSDGLVSGLRSFGNTQYLQISCPISRGSSGGPVINLQGEAVGISAFMLSQGQNLNFAIPSTTLKHFIEYAKKMPPIQQNTARYQAKGSSQSDPKEPQKPEERYVFIGTTDLNEKAFIDSHSIVQNGSTFELWYIQTLSSKRVNELSTNKGRADRLEMLIQIDCSRKRYRAPKIIIWSTYGNILNQLTDTNAPWEQLRPNTIGELVCRYLKENAK